MLTRDQLKFWITSLIGLMISSFLLRLERYVEMTYKFTFLSLTFRLEPNAAMLRLKNHQDSKMVQRYKRQIIKPGEILNLL